MTISNKRKKLYKARKVDKSIWYHYTSTTGIQISMKSYPAFYNIPS